MRVRYYLATRTHNIYDDIREGARRTVSRSLELFRNYHDGPETPLVLVFIYCCKPLHAYKICRDR